MNYQLIYLLFSLPSFSSLILPSPPFFPFLSPFLPSLPPSLPPFTLLLSTQHSKGFIKVLSLACQVEATDLPDFIQQLAENQNGLSLVYMHHTDSLRSGTSYQNDARISLREHVDVSQSYHSRACTLCCHNMSSGPQCNVMSHDYDAIHMMSCDVTRAYYDVIHMMSCDVTRTRHDAIHMMSHFFIPTI